MAESRLDRLLKLIDTAQSPAYRRLAAKQLGGLVQAQPNQARPLLQMLDGMIYSKNWDTRIACSYALEYIFTSLPSQFSLEPLTSESYGAGIDLLKEMDLSTEIRSRKALLASAGSEFDLDLTISAAERLKISRANMKKTLGFDDIAGMEELEKELARDEDFSAGVTAQQQKLQQSQKTQEPQIDLEKMSARERIAMKRKARLKPQAAAPPAKQMKKSSADGSVSVAAGSSENLTMDSMDSIESDALWFCEKMKEKLLNPNWQVRHGALLGLRAVLGRGLPLINAGDSLIISESSQEGWIDFLLGDILLVLGLDRFGDFIGDQVVAPVKETAAQLFALIYKRLDLEKRNCLVTRHVRALMNFEQWQVRHAGLLGLKHILANLESVGAIGELSDRVVDLLSDGDEDVRSVAAEVLCSLLSSGRHASIDLKKTFGCLQILLQGLDELSPSVAPILDLLGQLVSLDAAFVVDSAALLPFLRHASAKVRRQVIKVLGAMSAAGPEEIEIILVQLIQSMAVELDREINDSTLSLSLDLLTITDREALFKDERVLDNLFEIATCPLGHPYNPNNFKFLPGSDGPAGHDLAFKKSDMMLISEEEAIVQRINVSRALGEIIKTGSSYSGAEKQKLKLTKSSWCIHHLIHLWIFGFETTIGTSTSTRVSSVGSYPGFIELSALTNSLQVEFARFCPLIQISNGPLSSISRAIEEFRTRSEKSVEALSQFSVLEACYLQFESENSKLSARMSICRKGDDLTGNLLSALRLETNSRLQEFYARELAAVMEGDSETMIESELLKDIGDFMSLDKLPPSPEREWAELNLSGDCVWRAGRFIFKELSKSAVIVAKSLAYEREIGMNFLVGLFNGIKERDVAETVIVREFDLIGKLKAADLLESKFTTASPSLASTSLCFALLVRLEILVSSTSKLLERFLHELLFTAEARRVFPVILEVLNRCSQYETVILPMVPVFLKRTLMEINDSDGVTRKLASLTFSQLIRIAPLAAGIQSAGLLSEKTEELIVECREFLEQLQGPSTALPDFKPPCKLNVEMRPYQQAGLNWLAFLKRFNLHGALCDDMGLGKTLQTLSIIASDHFELKQQQQLDSKGVFVRSLIVCPASLTGHWEAEIRQYCPTLEAPLLYVGASTHRQLHLHKKLAGAEIVVTSYDVLRTDSSLFTDLPWNYCVLDEGHLIKNPKTKLSAAVRGLKAKRRLLLSGTPIQNNLLELWALFEFLLPGYLGSEKEFTDRYAKPILILQHSHSSTGDPSSAVGKWTQRDFDEAEGKLQSLHKQVLPFILRRMKEDVLSDLPPKIIQDYKCPMSSIQKLLYDDLLKGSGVKTEISKFVKDKFRNDDGADEEDISSEASEIEYPSNNNNNNKQPHVFQVLQYLRKLCVHPSLVLTPGHHLMPEINSELQRNNMKMSDLSVAPKFQMLKELLVECGLGDEDSDSANHRVLIFAQHKTTLDLIEEVVFKAHLPQISYMRLDGGVEPTARYPIVSKFNTDMTIDVLLLTTHVGGLGLNLTTADTVIFMDPDWNPMKDLQAMDRAHRLGQKRVVNVYRLLLRDTLEDRIMSLQRWKTKVAGTVISQQNSEAVNHENLLDLFDEEEATTTTTKSEASRRGKSSGGHGPEWHVEDDSDLAAREAEYAEEFNRQ